MNNLKFVVQIEYEHVKSEPCVSLPWKLFCLLTPQGFSEFGETMFFNQVSFITWRKYKSLKLFRVQTESTEQISRCFKNNTLFEWPIRSHYHNKVFFEGAPPVNG